MAQKPELILPNIRRLFIPDPGMVICDVDLAGADAQVVAWEAEDEDLKDAFRKGLKVHKKNAADMWGERFTSLDENSAKYKQMYKSIKSGVHGTNYGATARTVAITQGWSEYEAREFQSRWFKLHPGILRWHQRVKNQLAGTRCVVNAYGFKRPYFDRIDSCFTEALAWTPKSTVAITCFKGAINVRKTLPWVQMLLQVHDSCVFQIPEARVRDLPLVRRALLNPVPYPSDPLTIPWGLSLSSKSWGDVKDVKWEETADLRL
jgi:DNA polymerase I-like protein with 3'-5' exonuclease and polymerase domains